MTSATVKRVPARRLQPRLDGPDAVLPMHYFGKLPSRADFIRSDVMADVSDTLDQWVTHALMRLSADTRWKQVYDEAPPLHFGFVPLGGKAALTGHLLPGMDANGRCFPLATAALFDMHEPLHTLARAPMLMARPWGQCERAAAQACESTSAAGALHALDRARVEMETSPLVFDATYRYFLDMQSVDTLDGMLQSAGHVVRAADVLVALNGLRPLLGSARAAGIEQGLRLPLPLDPLYLPYVATLWTDLVARALARTVVEVAVYMAHGHTVRPPTLVIGLAGGSPTTLQAVLDPQTGDRVLMTLDDAARIEARLAHVDARTGALLDELRQQRCSLQHTLGLLDRG